MSGLRHRKKKVTPARGRGRHDLPHRGAGRAPSGVLVALFLFVMLPGCEESPTSTGSAPKLAAFETEIIESKGEFPNARDVFFLDRNTGVVVTYYGRIVVTADGGETWETRESGTDSPLRGIYFPSDEIGYVVGGLYGDGVFLKTTDGGDTWTRIEGPAEAEWHSVYFTSESKGYLVGLGAGHIYATADGGETWEAQYAFKGLLTDVHFIDENTGFACGIHGTILKTVDGGEEWIDISPANVGETGFVQSIDFDGGVGFAAARTDILETTDDGATWPVVHQFIGWVDDCVVVDSQKVVAVGGGVYDEWINWGAVHVSLDGGSTWTVDDQTHSYSALHVVDAGLVVGVSSASLIKVWLR